MAVTMKWPATCKTITQGYGNPSSRYVSGRHTGVDLGCMTGSPVYAAHDGTVTVAGYQGAYGNTVEIAANSSLTTSYHHMSVIKARKGQVVSAGTVIGFVGSTGNSTGPHLHFEVRIGGKHTDPMPYLNGSSSVIPASTDATQAGLTDIPGSVVKAFETLSDPITWMRIGMVLLGAALLSITFLGMAKTKALGNAAVGAVKKVGTSGKS